MTTGAEELNGGDRWIESKRQAARDVGRVASKCSPWCSPGLVDQRSSRRPIITGMVDRQGERRKVRSISCISR